MNHPTPLTPEQFSDLLRKEIGKSEYNAKQVFEKADLPITYLYKWKSGTVRPPTPAEITHFAQILGKSPYYFLFGRNSDYILLKISHLEEIMKHSKSISLAIHEVIKTNSLDL